MYKSVKVTLELNRQTLCDLAEKKNMIDTVCYSMTNDWIKLNFSITEEELKESKILNYILAPIGSSPLMWGGTIYSIFYYKICLIN